MIATDEILGIKVTSDYSLCEELSEKVKHYDGKLSVVKEENYKNEATNKPKVILKLFNNNEVDAESFYENKIKENQEKLDKET